MTTVTISNDVRITDYPLGLLNDLREKVDFTTSVRKRVYGQTTYETEWVHQLSVYNGVAILPYGAYPLVQSIFPNAEYRYATMWGIQEQWGRQVFAHEDRDSQVEVLDAMRQAFREKRYGFCVVAPCGAGKTRMALRMLGELSRRSIVFCHTAELLEQWRECAKVAFPDMGEPMLVHKGRIYHRRTDYITLALIQTARKMTDELALGYSVCVLDEAHHCPATTFADTVGKICSTVKIGVTASSVRADRMHPVLYATIGPIISRIRQDDLNREGVTMPPEIRFIDTGWHTTIDMADDYVAGITQLVNSRARNAIVAHAACELIRDGRRILVLSSRVAHLATLREAIMAECPGTTQLLTGKEKAPLRKLAMQRMRDGSCPCTLATDTLAKEGLDAPMLDGMVMATPFRDPIKAQQAVGRIQRSAEGKRTPLVIDFSDDNAVLQSQERARRAVYRQLMQI